VNFHSRHGQRRARKIKPSATKQPIAIQASGWMLLPDRMRSPRNEVVIAAPVIRTPARVRSSVTTRSCSSNARLACLLVGLPNSSGASHEESSDPSCSPIYREKGEADDGGRTRDLRLGKPTLYQLSYVRDDGDAGARLSRWQIARRAGEGARRRALRSSAVAAARRQSPAQGARSGAAPGARRASGRA
jgi:hypothetical protein